MKEGEGFEITVRKIQGFREWARSARDAGRGEPAWDAGMAPQEGRGQPGRPLARGTRTIRMCSFDARNRGSTRPPPKEIDKKEWKNRGGWPDDLLCSRNARPEKALVGRAQ